MNATARDFGHGAVVTPEAVSEARRALGRALAEWRSAAGVAQTDLARLVCWSRSTVANVETGRQVVPRLFWQRCDHVVDAHGLLLAEAERAEELGRRYREQVAAQRSRERLAAWPSQRCRCGGGFVRVPVGLGWPADAGGQRVETPDLTEWAVNR